MIFERHIVFRIIEKLMFPSLQYLFLFCFVKIVCVTTCFGHRRPSSGGDAQFLSILINFSFNFQLLKY
jgi:hypothetical protein